LFSTRLWLDLQVCVTSAKSVIYLINSRDSSIISDVELSLLKVAHLERIHFHEQKAYVSGNSLSVISTADFTPHRPIKLLACGGGFLLTFISIASQVLKTVIL
jgi:hypothetical protein